MHLVIDPRQRARRAGNHLVRIAAGRLQCDRRFQLMSRLRPLLLRCQQMPQRGVRLKLLGIGLDGLAVVGFRGRILMLRLFNVAAIVIRCAPFPANLPARAPAALSNRVKACSYVLARNRILRFSSDTLSPTWEHSPTGSEVPGGSGVVCACIHAAAARIVGRQHTSKNNRLHHRFPAAAKSAAWFAGRKHRASHCPVCDSGAAAICSGVPAATIPPPRRPPSGPRSMIQSAAFSTSRLCSITSSDPPLSINWRSAESNLLTSSKCNPVVGSSRI